MNEPRNRSRKVTRKAGPPAENETASNEAASPVFQAPATDAGNSAQENSAKGDKGNSGTVSYTHLTLPTTPYV